ncbi:unnamed protein product [Pieris macdunnoughi]|uniref:Uncharacterized protein n=1 Tax=Pieris macdunnoughi TaxID=345717 RepID=A0A821S6R7_9NEOP|nr:unnamed protein product [Pieris macdunnoughi]
MRRNGSRHKYSQVGRNIASRVALERISRLRWASGACDGCPPTERRYVAPPYDARRPAAIRSASEETSSHRQYRGCIRY